MQDIKLIAGGDRTDHFFHWFQKADAKHAALITTALHEATIGHYSKVKGIGGGLVTVKHNGQPGFTVFLGHEKWSYNHWVVLAILVGSNNGQQGGKYRYRGQGKTWGAVRKTWSRYLASLQNDVPLSTVNFGSIIMRRLEADQRFAFELGESCLYSLCDHGTEPAKFLIRLLITAGPGYKALAAFMDSSELRLQEITSHKGHCSVQELIQVINTCRKCIKHQARTPITEKGNS